MTGPKYAEEPKNVLSKLIESYAETDAKTQHKGKDGTYVETNGRYATLFEKDKTGKMTATAYYKKGTAITDDGNNCSGDDVLKMIADLKNDPAGAKKTIDKSAVPKKKQKEEQMVGPRMKDGSFYSKEYIDPVKKLHDAIVDVKFNYADDKKKKEITVGGAKYWAEQNDDGWVSLLTMDNGKQKTVGFFYFKAKELSYSKGGETLSNLTQEQAQILLKLAGKEKKVTKQTVPRKTGKEEQKEEETAQQQIAPVTNPTDAMLQANWKFIAPLNNGAWNAFNAYFGDDADAHKEGIQSIINAPQGEEQTKVLVTTLGKITGWYYSGEGYAVDGFRNDERGKELLVLKKKDGTFLIKAEDCRVSVAYKDWGYYTAADRTAKEGTEDYYQIGKLYELAAGLDLDKLSKEDREYVLGQIAKITNPLLKLAMSQTDKFERDALFHRLLYKTDLYGTDHVRTEDEFKALSTDQAKLTEWTKDQKKYLVNPSSLTYQNLLTAAINTELAIQEADEKEFADKETKKKAEEKEEVSEEKVTEKKGKEVTDQYEENMLKSEENIPMTPEETTTKETETPVSTAGIFAGVEAEQWFLDFGASTEMKNAYTALLDRYDQGSVDAILASSDFAKLVTGYIASDVYSDPGNAKERLRLANKVAGDIVTFMPKEKGTEKKTGSTSIFAGMDVDQRFIDFGSSKEMGDAYNDLIGGTYRYDKASVDAIIKSDDFAMAIQGLVATNAAQWDMDSKKAEDRKARAKDVENLIVQFKPKEKTSGYEANTQKQKQQPKIKEKPPIKENPEIIQTGASVFSGSYATDIDWVNNIAGKNATIADWVEKNLADSKERDAVLGAFKDWVNSETFPYSSETAPKNMTQAVDAMMEQLEDMKKKYNSR